MRVLFPFLLVILTSLCAVAQTIDVMSYNIHVGQNAANEDKLLEIARFIKSSGADIVGLQEVDSMCNRSGKVDQMKFLAEYTGMHYAYVRHFAFDGGSYGLGVLSKYPLRNVENKRLSLISESNSATRALLTANVSVKGSDVTFATVHLDYRDGKSRQQQARELLNHFSNLNTAVILTGDFNAPPGTDEINTLETFFKETELTGAGTYPVQNPTKKIDYIMVDKKHLLKVKRSEVHPVQFSDHLPLSSRIKLAKN